MADTKLSAMTELTSLSSTDQFYVTPLVTGTRRDRRMTAANLATGIKALAGGAGTAGAVGLAVGAATVGLFSGGSGATEYLGLAANGVEFARSVGGQTTFQMTQSIRGDTTASGGLWLQGTATTTASVLSQFRALHSDVYHAGTHDTGTFSGQYSIVHNSASSGTISHFLGVVGRAFSESAGGIGLCAGVYGDFASTGSAGAMTNACAFYASPPTVSAGTITNAYGLWVNTITPTTGTIANSYAACLALPTGAGGNNIGLLIGAAPSSTTASLYVASGLTYHGGTTKMVGSVGIATDAETNTRFVVRSATGFAQVGIQYDASNFLAIYANSGGRGQFTCTGSTPFCEFYGAGTTVTGLKKHLSARDSASVAAGVGGGIALTGNYTAGGTEGVFAGIRAYKENSTDGEYGGHLDLYSRAHGASAAMGARLTSAKNFLIQGGLGVGNSASASTLGTVTKKVEIFDASGASLGFVPVYDAIT